MRCVAVVLLLSACFSPGFTSGQFKCVPGSQCPPGFACDTASGTCVSAAPVDLAMSLPDLAQRPVDLALPKSIDAAQQRMAPACSSGVGTMVGNHVWACTGAFASQSNQNALCGTGYAVCTTGVNVSEATCASAGGFFLVDYAFSADVVQLQLSFNCGSESGNTKALLGCGSNAAFQVPACVGLTGGTACQGTAFSISGWSCTNGFADAINTNAADGVLCCPTSPPPPDMARAFDDMAIAG